MFAKGPMPGWSPKKECLKIYPNAVCRDSGHTTNNQKVYFIYPDTKEHSTPILGETSPKLAWERLWCKLVDEGKLDTKGNKVE